METKTENKVKVRITVAQDAMAENPMTDRDGQWTLYSFNRWHENYKDPEQVGFENGRPTIGLRRKLTVGTAFIAGYYEHGACRWDVSGTRDYPDAQWDACSVAGLLVWEHDVGDMGAKSYEDRQKDAQQFLDIYTDWCNGCASGFRIEIVRECESCGAEQTEDVESCWGFFDSDSKYMMEEINAVLQAHGWTEETADIEWTGDKAFIVGH